MKYYSENIDELTAMQEDLRAAYEKLDIAERENRRLTDIIEKLGIDEQGNSEINDLKEKLAESEEFLNEERRCYSKNTNKLVETINQKDEETRGLNIRIAKLGKELNKVKNKLSDTILKNKRLAYMEESMQADHEKKNSEMDDLERELTETESFLKEEIAALRKNLRVTQKELFSVTIDNKKLLHMVGTLKFELLKKNAEPDKLEKEQVESESSMEKKVDNIKTEDLMQMTIQKDKTSEKQNAVKDAEQITGGVTEIRKELEDRIRALESKN